MKEAQAAPAAKTADASPAAKSDAPSAAPAAKAAEAPPAQTAAPGPPPAAKPKAATKSAARYNPVGTISLLVAAIGTVLCHLARSQNLPYAAEWLPIVTAGFEAALIGGLADWFAVTALFRHPFGIPIPHTAIIAERRGKITESIVTMVEDEWLSPEVIGARLKSIAPSELVIDWLEDEEHVQRLGAPLRDLLGSLARVLTEPEVVDFVGRTMRGQLKSLAIDESAGKLLQNAISSGSLDGAFESVAYSVANLLERPTTAEQLQLWLDQAARELRRDGRRVLPMLLRRKIVRRTIVDAGCRYAGAELLYAAEHEDHPLRLWAFANIEQFAERLSRGDADAIRLVEQFRSAVVASLEVEPLVGDMLESLSEQLNRDLAEPQGYLAELVDRKLRSAILDLLKHPERREIFDRWVRETADNLLRKNHHQIGVTVRENLEALETGALVRQIEDRVGADLQFIRLNGALVGGLIGVVLALLHRWVG